MENFLWRWVQGKPHLHYSKNKGPTLHLHWVFIGTILLQPSDTKSKQSLIHGLH